jgi:galactose mutarotase-like enzyme
LQGKIFLMIKLENEFLTVTVNPAGAELTSLFNKETQLEYMWSGDAAVWAKHSPVLFPIVGTLKNNSYTYNEQSYSLSRHGFARERIFTVDEQTNDEAIFALASDEESRAVFPFDFRLRLKYSLLGNTLSVTYEVQNTGDHELFFSVGAHPAFKLPLVPGTSYEDYFLEFDQPETADRWPISKDGLIEKSSLPLLKNSAVLPLSKELFEKDALVLKSLKSSMVSLRSAITPHGLEFLFSGFPFLGLWAAKGGDFVCIEPWCGISDSVDADRVLQHKEGINKLAVKEKFVRTWSVKVL